MVFSGVNYNMSANGYTGNLRINSIGSNGEISGSCLGDPIFGFWNEDAKKIIFMRIIDNNDHRKDQIYTGYEWSEKGASPGADRYYLAGSFEAFAGAGGTANRSVFGWLASHNLNI